MSMLKTNVGGGRELTRRRSLLPAPLPNNGAATKANSGLPGMVGTSAPMRKAVEQVQLVAPNRSTVLITGESGTGKELVARAIHQLSPRKDGPCVVLNCAAIPKDLAESELFGHCK